MTSARPIGQRATSLSPAHRRPPAQTSRHHLGPHPPSRPVRAALVGYIAFAETTCEQWRALGLTRRGDLERLLADVLVATVAAAGPDQPTSRTAPPTQR